MKVSELRNYGVAGSDAEANWPASLKQNMERVGRKIVFARLGWAKGFRFVLAFAAASRAAKKADLSAIRARGMTNETFIAQQVEYIVTFSALASVVGTERAVSIMDEVMDATAKEALLLCLPDAEDLRRFDDPFAAFREYLHPVPAASRKAGCHEVVIVEDREEAFQFDIRWCVWLELARLLGAPDACRPNCYADQLVYPDYFASLGIEYRRTGTLAEGASCCDFRFERRSAG